MMPKIYTVIRGKHAGKRCSVSKDLSNGLRLVKFEDGEEAKIPASLIQTIQHDPHRFSQQVIEEWPRHWLGQMDDSETGVQHLLFYLELWMKM